MKAKEIMTLEHAIFWAKKPGTQRKAEYEIKRDWSDSECKVSIYVYDSAVGIGKFLPIPFKGDISKFLCESKQEELMESIDRLKKQLDASITNCDGED